MTEDKPALTQVNTSLPEHVLAKIHDYAQRHSISRSAAMRHILTWHTLHHLEESTVVHVVPGDDIQAAVNSVADHPNGIVVFAPGTYTMDRPIIINRTTTLKADQ